MRNPIKKILNEISYLTGRHCSKPEFLSLVLTHRCNFQCPACSIWRQAGQTEMDRTNWIRTAKKIRKFFPSSAFVELNGGEALMKKNLTYEILRELSGHFANITINTNGSMINQETADELKKYNVSVKLSLYSLDQDIHDSLRGQKRAHERAMSALDLLAKNNIKTEIAILVTRHNIETLPELITYLSSLNNVAIIIQALDEIIESPETLNLSANFLPLDLWPDRVQSENFFFWLDGHAKSIKNSPENLKAIKNYYLDPESALSFRCFAGQRSLIIHPNGDVYFCFKGRSLGNIKKEKLKHLISGKNAMTERKRIASCPKYCRILGCNFSRGLKEAQKG